MQSADGISLFFLLKFVFSLKSGKLFLRVLLVPECTVSCGSSKLYPGSVSLYPASVSLYPVSPQLLSTSEYTWKWENGRK